MDLVILVVLIAIVVAIFKKFSSFVYFIAIIDIFLRILTFIKIQLGIPELTSFFNKYFPVSVPGIINSYSNGIFNTILTWGYIVIFVIFEFYIIRTFFKKK